MKKETPLAEETIKILNKPLDQRLQALIESPFTAEILERIPTQDAYLVVKEAFGSDSSILLTYTPTEKIISFIDLDCWDRDTLSAQSLLEWIAELSEASHETLVRTLEALDPEIIILLFQPYLNVVITQPTDDNIPELIEAGYETLDSNYFFTFSENTEETAALRNILNMVFNDHQDLYYRIVEGVRWELPSDMEESAYRQHMLRLMELGFPTPDEARSAYRQVKTERILARGFRPEQTPRFGSEEYFIPTIYRDEINKTPMALHEDISADTRQRFSFELVYLANKIIMADALPLNDMQAMRASTEKALSFTALGLALARRAKAATTQAILDSLNAQSLFSLGYNAVCELQHRMKEILSGVAPHMIPPGIRDITDALRPKITSPVGLVIASLEQFDHATAMLDRLDTLRRIIRHIPWKGHVLTDTNIGVEGLDMENILLTALAVNISSGDLIFRPLRVDELSAFFDRTTEIRGAERHCTAHFHDDLCTLLSTLDHTIPAELLQATAAGLITRWEEEIAGLGDQSRIDPRFLTCLVVTLKAGE